MVHALQLLLKLHTHTHVSLNNIVPYRYCSHSDDIFLKKVGYCKLNPADSQKCLQPIVHAL